MSLELAQKLVEVASGYLGVKEIAKNRGPEIDAWLLRVGLDPEKVGGHPWCAAAAWCWLDDACKALFVRNPVLRSARVMTLWRKTPSNLVSLMPRVGSIFCHATRPDDIESPGHCGIVMGVGGDHIATIEANTNEAGDREGDCVARKLRRLDYVNLGYIDVERI